MSLTAHKSLSLFALDDGESCSAVISDTPRGNCSRDAVAVCMGEGCEAALCEVHVTVCEGCGGDYCENCWEEHECEAKQ
jgi:hypothetical protein